MGRNVSPATYWSTLKTFLNNKKIPCILQYFTKTSLLQILTKNQYDRKSLFQINAKYWTTLISFLRNYQHKPTSYEILRIIQNLDPDKAHGHDIISIPLLKVCGLSVCKPLELIFKPCIGNELILQNGKKQIFFQKIKNDKQLLRNCRTVLLLPICGKVFERLIDNKMFEFFINHNLIFPHQLGFKPGHSCINQLSSVRH